MYLQDLDSIIADHESEEDLRQPKRARSREGLQPSGHQHSPDLMPDVPVPTLSPREVAVVNEVGTDVEGVSHMQTQQAEDNAVALLSSMAAARQPSPSSQPCKQTHGAPHTPNHDKVVVELSTDQLLLLASLAQWPRMVPSTLPPGFPPAIFPMPQHPCTPILMPNSQYAMVRPY